MDRSIIGVLGPTLQYKVFNWSDVDYANINISFKVAYALGMLSMGAVIDKLGSRLGYAVSIIIWSVFGMLHAVIQPAFGLIGFILARFGLGLGEAGNFPAAIKTVAEWFPKNDRAFATGIFNAGSNVGAILAPLAIPLVVASNGDNWQYAFLLTGVFSLIWVILWLRFYKSPELHPKVSADELKYIQSGQNLDTGIELEKLNWRKVLPLRETWAFAIGKITDAAWWFYLFWGGKFLFDQFGLNIKKLAIPLMVIYLIADVGSIGGGWVSKYFIDKGWSINKARKTTLFLCTLFILPVMFTTQIKTSFTVNDQLLAKMASAFAAGGHQAFSANLFTIPSDLFPKRAVASVVGIGGMIGALSGLVADFSLGQILQASGTAGYFFAFLGAGLVYLICLAIIHFLTPNMTPLNDNLKKQI
ncbi:MAG: MFS transporter [Saprospiraceae bacterium]|nr:MFS transporter [Saprospiraceae bacterium]